MITQRRFTLLKACGSLARHSHSLRKALVMRLSTTRGGKALFQKSRFWIMTATLCSLSTAADPIFLTAAADDSTGWRSSTVPAVSARILSASDLDASSGAYLGRPVQLRSTVSRSFGPHAFVVNDEPLLAAPDVLVLVPHPLA